MGLKKCPDCSEDIQATARVCKHCGWGKRAPAPAGVSYGFVMRQVVGAAFLLVLAACFFWPRGASVPSPDAQRAAEEEQRFIEERRAKFEADAAERRALAEEQRRAAREREEARAAEAERAALEEAYRRSLEETPGAVDTGNLEERYRRAAEEAERVMEEDRRARSGG